MDILHRYNKRDRRVSSVLLRDETILKNMRMENLVWIKPINLSWEHTLRRPCIGCIVDIRWYQDQNYVHIDSPKGQKIIWKNCYRK